MSPVPHSLPRSGWYQDPGAFHEYRFWNGESWTAGVADEGRVTEDPPDPTWETNGVLPRRLDPKTNHESARFFDRPLFRDWLVWLSFFWLVFLLVGPMLVALVSNDQGPGALSVPVGVLPVWWVVTGMFFLGRELIRRSRAKRGHLRPSSRPRLGPHAGEETSERTLAQTGPTGARVAMRVLLAFGITAAALFLFSSCATSFLCSGGCL
jgi:hypothetical protein